MPLELQIRRNNANPISPDEFAFVISKSGAKQVDSNAYRQMHSSDCAGFLIEFLTNESSSCICVSLSYSNPSFINICGESIETSLKVADYLGAQLQEGFTGKTISDANVSRFTDSSSEFILEIRHHWDQQLVEMNRQNRAPLEFPVKGADTTEEYFCLNIFADQPLSFNDLESALGLSLKRSSDTEATCYDKASLRPHCKLTLGTHNKLRIQPYYWKQPFERSAIETMQVADLIQALFGGQVFFFETLLDENNRTLIDAQCKSLGMDFALRRGRNLAQA